jgi:hypothetical protein
MRPQGPRRLPVSGGQCQWRGRDAACASDASGPGAPDLDSDSSSRKVANDWSHNAVDFVRSKHIETSVRVCAVREHVQELKTVKLQYIPTYRQLADILTKNTVPTTFQYLRQGLLGLKKRIFG